MLSALRYEGVLQYAPTSSIFWLINYFFLTRYDSRDTRYEFGSWILSLDFFFLHAILDTRYFSLLQYLKWRFHFFAFNQNILGNSKFYQLIIKGFHEEFFSIKMFNIQNIQSQFFSSKGSMISDVSGYV